VPWVAHPSLLAGVGDFKNVFQILESDFGGAVVEGNIDTEQAVPSRDVENLRRLAGDGDVRHGDACWPGEHESQVACEPRWSSRLRDWKLLGFISLGALELD
jgi:hypothetical protein